MTDYHCHLDLYPNALELLPQVNKRNAFTLAVTTSPRAWRATSTIFSTYPNITVALGFHPELVDDRINELSTMLTALEQVKFVGEIGIDGTAQNAASVNIQIETFKCIVEKCGKRKTHVLSVHSRAAASRVLDILEKRNPNTVPILHWFTGNRRELDRAISIGCWFSVNPQMLASSSGMSIASCIPLDRVLPETDGPFTHCGHTPYMPWDAMKVCVTLGLLHRESPSSVNTILAANSSIIQQL